MEENVELINSVLNACLSGYSLYDDDIVENINKETVNYSERWLVKIG